MNHWSRWLTPLAMLGALLAPRFAAADDTSPGLIADVYLLDKPITKLADAPQNTKPTRQVIEANVDIGSPARLSVLAGSGEQVFVRWAGEIQIDETAKHTFILNSDDGSRLLIDGKVVVDHDGLHGATEARADARLTAGRHQVVVEYFNNTGGAMCALSWRVTPGGQQVIPAGVFFHDKAAAAAIPKPQPAPKFSLSKGLRISIVGNTLAERMQHDGWMETLLQAASPGKELTFRNLGFSADSLTVQNRVDGFGSQDEWLARTQADAIFAFFGFNESFAGEAGLEAFKSDLSQTLDRWLRQQYNGQSPPAIVLFSPIAQENLNTPNLPDGLAGNPQIKQYADAIAEVATARGVKYVDLFTPTLAAYQREAKPLTINGVHLNERGNRVVGEAIAAALGAASDLDETLLEKLRQAVVDKNFYYFNRYQTTDGYNVHGGRSHKVYAGVSNREVMMREMEILEAMATNRDQRIWALAQGQDLAVDDNDTPAFIPTPTNFPGPGKNGEHVYLSGEEALAKMKVAEGLKVELFASEEQFPELINPVQMAFDPQGRLFCCAWPSYPHWTPKDKMDDKLLILIDNDGDGKADECKTFADGLHNPTGFEFWGGGVLVAMAPDILFLKDTDGDDQADVRMRVLHGISSGDTHHAANSFTIGPGGALYFQEGTFHRSSIETPYGPVRNLDGCMWRFEPGTWKVHRHIPYGFANPHGHVYDYWGQGFMHDGTGAVPYHETLFSGHLPYPDRHGRAPELYKKRTRPCPATEILSSSHFPPESQGNLLVENVIGFQGILQYKVTPDGSSFQGKEIEPIIESTDLNFRPVDLEIGPDGALYFTDWQNPIIGHLQHHIRDPNRDKKHGRVYRITCEGRDLIQPVPVAGEPIPALLELLKSHEDRVRYRAKIELSSRDSAAVTAAVDKWAAALDKADPDYAHNLLEALWVHQYHNVVNEALLRQVLRSDDHRARAAATRVLGYWHDRVKDPLDLLLAQVTDEHPLVRLEAVRALSFIPQEEAQLIALEAANLPMDAYLEYTFNETMKTLTKLSK
ncbi:PVC-type heme-binding CxxCH protein [Lignipirellula cremea]|nr:PVC-type heme-binding CxxCH protein [Lignipirellula cremea]